MGAFPRTKNITLRNKRYRTPIQKQQNADDLNKLYTSLGTNMSGIRRDVRAREDRYQQVEDELLDAFQRQRTRSSKSSRSTSVQPKASESAPPKVKAGGSKEVPVALESDVEEINPLREGETKPRRWSTEKPDPLDPPKRQKSKPPKGKGVARSDPDDSDSSSSDSSGGYPKKKNDRHSLPSSSSSSSSDSSSESGVSRKKDSSDEDRPRWHEFHNRSNKKKNNGRSANARKGKGNNTRDGKPAWNKDGQPLCFNCGSSRNTRGGGQSEEQFIPEGLRDLYRSNGKTFSAHIEEQQLQYLMRWYDEMIQKADTTVASVLESAEAAEATEAVAADCTDCTEIESPKRPELQKTQSPELQKTQSPELQAIQSPEPQGTDCPELRLQATESTVLQATERPEVTKTNRAEVTATGSFIRIKPQVTERTEPQVADCPEATKAIVVGNAMLLHMHSSMEDDRDKLLWDSGANVNITNNIGDFERDSILDIRSKGIHIMTGGGPVAATSIGTVKWPLRGPHGENNEVTVKYTLHISDFPLKVFSGEIFYRRGGYLDKNTLVGPNRDQLTTINVPRRGFFLWLHGKLEPTVKGPESLDNHQ
ncbi:hypothetical protein DL765_001665 [Monosporascus sp. GIB2]|nr:hypothetical protein DL765_001665 [Monosporascus sp. GIB2]